MGRTSIRPRIQARGSRSRSGSETGATRSMNGRPAVVMARERGWARSVPWSVTPWTWARTPNDGQMFSPKWAWTTSKRVPR